jgi:sulfur-oxidizing protein SoxY
MDTRLTRKLSRRCTIHLGLVSVVATAWPRIVEATPADVTNVITDMFGARPIEDGRISLTVPKLAESGNSVPLAVSVDSPMLDDDFVRRVVIFADDNPRPKVVEVNFSPASGAAYFETNIRLSGTQDIVALAEMSDGSVWRRRERIRVVIGACTVLSTRY